MEGLCVWERSGTGSYTGEVKGYEKRVGTCYADTIDVVWDDTFCFDDVVELGTCAVENDGIEADTVEEAKTEGEFIELVEDGASDLDDCELCGLGRV